MLDIDTAIKHCLEVAEKEEQFCVQDDRSCLFQKSHAECAADHRQLAEWLTELKEAKRLLKAAVEDLAKIPCNNDVYIPSSCNACIKQGNCDYSDSFKWRYADEALALIGEDGEQK